MRGVGITSRTVGAVKLDSDGQRWIVVREHELDPVAYPGILFAGGGGVQQIQLRTERTGIWGAVAP